MQRPSRVHNHDKLQLSTTGVFVFDLYVNCHAECAIGQKIITANYYCKISYPNIPRTEPHEIKTSVSKSFLWFLAIFFRISYLFFRWPALVTVRVMQLNNKSHLQIKPSLVFKGVSIWKLNILAPFFTLNKMLTVSSEDARWIRHIGWYILSTRITFHRLLRTKWRDWKVKVTNS